MIEPVELAVAVLGLAVIVLAALLFRVWKRDTPAPMPESSSPVPVTSPPPPRSPTLGVPLPPRPSASAIAIGVGDSRAMEIRIAASGDVLAGSPRVESGLVRTALASVPQALPQLVLAQQVSGSHLMEVVIRGDLVRAVDGGGWRAFSIGQNGIEQHARLFEVGGLQAFAAGVMIWQLASIVFGQKHLLDINRQLVGINQKLDSILGMLRSERRATILAGWRYVQDAVHAAERGELNGATRQQLEAVEYQLTVALYAIRAEFDEVRRRPLARGKIGTSLEFESLTRNLDEYRAIFEDMSACVEVRQACCYAASLYPGGRVLLGKRLQGLHDDVEVFSTMGHEVSADTEQRVSEITSRWNKEATLIHRREGIGTKLREFTDSVAINAKRHEARGERIEAAMASLDETKTLYVTVNNGKVVAVHESMAGNS